MVNRQICTSVDCCFKYLSGVFVVVIKGISLAFPADDPDEPLAVMFGLGHQLSVTQRRFAVETGARQKLLAFLRSSYWPR